jgi:hypothetical protein
MRVEWKRTALDRMADSYVASDLALRDEIEKAVLFINKTLADDPVQGESRSRATQRAWHVPPVSIVFEILPSDGLVVVQHFAMQRRSK